MANSPKLQDAAAGMAERSGSPAVGPTPCTPESVKPEKRKAAAAAWASLVRQQLLECLDDISTFDRAGFFAQPVAEVVDDDVLQVYQRLIPHPIDLRTMRERLTQRSCYLRRPQRFVQDVERIAANAKEFNLDGSSVYVEADHFAAHAVPKATEVVRRLNDRRSQFEAPAPGTASDSDDEMTSDSPLNSDASTLQASHRSASSAVGQGDLIDLVPVNSRTPGNGRRKHRSSALAEAAQRRCVVCCRLGTPISFAHARRSSLDSAAHGKFTVSCWRCDAVAHLSCARTFVRDQCWSEALQDNLATRWTCQHCFRELAASASTKLQQPEAVRGENVSEKTPIQDETKGSDTDLPAALERSTARLRNAINKTYFRLPWLEQDNRADASASLDKSNNSELVQQFVGERFADVLAGSRNASGPNDESTNSARTTTWADSKLFSLRAFNEQQIADVEAATAARRKLHADGQLFDEDLVREEPFRGFQHGTFDDIWQSSPPLVRALCLFTAHALPFFSRRGIVTVCCEFLCCCSNMRRSMMWCWARCTLLG